MRATWYPIDAPEVRVLVANNSANQAPCVPVSAAWMMPIPMMNTSTIRNGSPVFVSRYIGIPKAIASRQPAR